MIGGTRQKTIGGSAYRNDPLYAFGKAFTEAANDILTVESYDIFAEPTRTLRNPGAKEALKEFFCENFVDDNNKFLSAEQIEELHEDAYEQCDIGSLQNLLDVWCKDQTGTTTYYPCYKQYVKIDWSKYEDYSR